MSTMTNDEFSQTTSVMMRHKPLKKEVYDIWAMEMRGITLSTLTMMFGRFLRKKSKCRKKSSNAQNVAFVTKAKAALIWLCLLYIPLFAKPSEDEIAYIEDLEQIEYLEIEEMEINWQVAMIAIRMKMFYKITGREVYGWKKNTCWALTKRKLNASIQEKNQMGLLTMDVGLSIGENILKVEEKIMLSWLKPHVVKQTPKVNRKNWNAMMERELGEGYSFTKKKCFVCGSLSHLIKDCDYYEKKMAKEAEVKKQRVCNTGNIMANQSNVNTGRTNVNPVRSTVNTGRSNVNTVRSRQPVPTKTSNIFSPKRPQENWAKITAQMSHSHAVKENWDLLLRPQQVIIGGTLNHTPIVTEHPLKNMVDRGIFDSGCSGHMTGNKDQLEDFEEFNGGSVTFGGSKGYIYRKVSVLNESRLKQNVVATYKIIKQGEKGVYQIVREDGTDIVYINFGAMLKSISRDDLTELYRIVMNRYGMDGPEDELEKVFWKCLKTMFEEPLSTDPIWSELGQQKIISWRYYDTCRVHCLNLESMDVYMLSERKYPLSAEVCQTMLKMKLLDGKMNEDCYRMLKMMEKQAGIRK
ncbi:hypothetical protein Tco_0533224 [Tanacetum coccineum]